MDTLVLLEHITKIYGEYKALDSVRFDLRAGEVHCLVGENGAGKSTLIKILAGAIAPDEGLITISDQPVKQLSPRRAIELGISTVYQDAELVDSLTVADNVFLGDERLSRIPLVVDRSLQIRKAQEIADSLHLTLPVKSLVEDLSTAQKQMLQIVKALYREARVVIMDEPTSSLGMEETRTLMDLIRRLRNRGIGIIYISHYLDEVFELGDRVTVLKDGKLMGTHQVSDVSMETIVQQMVGRDASTFYARRKVPIGQVQVQVRDYTKKGVVQDISFDIRQGEIFGIGGLVGSGRSELVNLLFGSDRSERGELILKGKKRMIRSPEEAIRQGISFITEDRKKFAMLRGRNVIENTALVHNEVFKGLLVDRQEERRLTEAMIGDLSIAVKTDDQTIEELSGGNQQKVIIGRWLLDDALLYIFDEPTKGVDIGAKAQIYELMVALAEQGKSLLMVSSDMPELLSMSDRIGIMRNGRMVEIMENTGISEEDLIKNFIAVTENAGEQSHHEES